MKEAIGQTISLQVILVFMIFLNAFLAFSVNYTKAFRVKNKVINEIEQNEGINNTSRTNIQNYTAKVGYTGKDDGSSWKNGIKVVPVCVGSVGASGDCENPISGKKYRVYYSVTTSININVPIIGPIFRNASGDMNLLQVKGDTSTIYIDGKNLKDSLEW